MMLLCRVAFVLIIIVVGGAHASARDIFVNNLGGDDNYRGSQAQSRGGDEDGPVATINRALSLAEPGDRIILANSGQPYHEMLSLSAAHHCGTRLQPLVIEGNGATLDGSRPVPPQAWEAVRGAVFRFRPARLAHQQLFLDGRPLARKHVTSPYGKLPDLEPLEWCLYDNYIYFRVEETKIPADYQLSHTALPVGITLYHVHDVLIAGLIVQGFQLDGINAHDGVRDCYLAGLNCRGNGRSGLAVAGCSHVEMSDSIVGDNGTAQVYTEALAIASIRDTQLLDNTAPPIVQAGGRVFVDGVEKKRTP